jgi:peptidoglycan/LPS O-acetylase OafA/YrhL
MLLRPDQRQIDQAERLDTQIVWNPREHSLELDGVRGLAIVMVTLYRVLKELPSTDTVLYAWTKSIGGLGEKGVDLFFVLSGFLITGILLRTRSKSNYFSNFLARRAIRIFPLYFVSLALCLVLIPRVLPPSAIPSSWDLPASHQLYLWTYTSNLWMSWTNSWCFGPLDHFWSLAVEEHFYFVWPAIVFLLSPKWIARLCIGTIVGVGLVRIGASTLPGCEVAVSVLTFFRCDGLCVGALLATLMHSHQTSPNPQGLGRLSQPRVWWLAVAATLGIGLIACLITMSGKRFYTLPSSLFPCFWGLSLALLLLSKPTAIAARIARTSVLRWFGRYSYGMYVFQLPLLTLVPFAVAKSWGGSYGLPYLIYAVASVAAICGLAFASFHLMEKHFLSCRKWFSS